MPRDANGNTQPLPGTIVSTGDTVLPSQHNPAMVDLYAMMTQSLSRDGQGGMRSNLDMSTFKLLNVANGTSAADAVNLSQLQAALPVQGTWVPTVTTSVGSITTLGSTAGIYLKIGVGVWFSLQITIVTNGSASGNIRVTNLPFAANTRSFVATGRANVISGKMLQGIIAPTSDEISIFNYDNTYPGASGETMNVTGFYIANS